MRLRSLRLRLGLAAAALIALALVLAGIGLALIFDAVLEARIVDDLDRTAKQIAGQVGLAPDGNPMVARELTDPRYAAPTADCTGRSRPARSSCAPARFGTGASAGWWTRQPQTTRVF